MTQSLRERKKAATRRGIQAAAMDLFAAQGYSATTVDQICERADVSPATFFRYFPSKDDVIVFDPVDELMIERARRVPADVDAMEALRTVFRETRDDLTPGDWQHEQLRARIIAETPELRARFMEMVIAGMGTIARELAARQGREVDEQLFVWAGAVSGAMLARQLWAPADHRQTPIYLDDALATLDVLEACGLRAPSEAG